MVFTIYSLLPFIFFIVYIIKWFYSSSTTQKKQLPSPVKLPIIGNLHQLGLLPHRSLQSLSKRHGPLMLLHFGSKPVLVVSSADAAFEIMKSHDLVFSNRPKSNIPHSLLYGSKDVAFAPYGEFWRQMRSICVLHLLSNKRVQSFRSVREEETSFMIENIRQKCISSSSSLINFRDIFAKLTNDVLCRVAFGRKCSGEENGRKAMAHILEFVQLLGVFDVGDYIPWLAWMNRFNGLDAQVQRVFKNVDEFIECIIEERRNKANIDKNTNEPRDSDLVDILLEIQKEKLAGFAIEPEAVKGVILDMFAGGTDTIQTSMEWTMAELLRHPKILKKLQTEVRQIVQGKSGIAEDDLDRMHYLKAVIKESLRLHPPAPLVIRESTRNVRVRGYDISAGTQVLVNGWAIGRDPKVWNNPEEFQPERFLNSNIDFRGFNFELIPFGSGRRGCPGISFAMAVNELALAKLMHKFDFALPDGAKPGGLDMSELNGLAVHQKIPLHAVAILHAY